MEDEPLARAVADTEREDKAWHRRGVLAAVWTALASIALKISTEPVSAGVDGDVVLGANNQSSSTTGINNTGSGPALIASTGGLLTTNAPMALIASNSNPDGYGVWGIANAPGSVGVLGQSPFGTGVWGSSSSGIAILGESNNGIALRAEATGSSAQTIAAVYGVNNSSYPGPGPGAGGFGVYGLSAKGHGLVGATAAAGGAAVVGATNGVAGAYAAAFYGPVIVGGNFTVVGGAKSAAVPHPDGSHRRLYCVESPESWFEDFGKGSLQCGRAHVAIDPDFAAVAIVDDYDVFVSAYDHEYLLHVTNRTPEGFTVQASLAFAALCGRSEDQLSGDFAWRVVARRKDITGERLAPVHLPAEVRLPVIPPVARPELPTLAQPQ